MVKMTRENTFLSPADSCPAPGLDTDTPNAETRRRERQLHYVEHRLVPVNLIFLQTSRLELEEFSQCTEKPLLGPTRLLGIFIKEKALWKHREGSLQTVKQGLCSILAISSLVAGMLLAGW